MDVVSLGAPCHAFAWRVGPGLVGMLTSFARFFHVRCLPMSATDAPQDNHSRFLALFVREQEDLRAFIGSAVRDGDAIDDIIQETAQVLWRKFPDYDPSRPFGAWARGIAGVEIHRYRERNRRIPVLFSPEAIAAIETVWEEARPATTRIDVLQACLDQVPEAQRSLLTMRYQDDLEIPEIARRVGRNVEAVTKILQRLRVALAECVRRQLAAEGL